MGFQCLFALFCSSAPALAPPPVRLVPMSAQFLNPRCFHATSLRDQPQDLEKVGGRLREPVLLAPDRQLQEVVGAIARTFARRSRYSWTEPCGSGRPRARGSAVGLLPFALVGDQPHEPAPAHWTDHRRQPAPGASSARPSAHVVHTKAARRTWSGAVLPASAFAAW